METLGFHRLGDEERVELETLFQKARVLPVDQAVIEQAASLRQQKRMSLGDAIVAATALVHDLALITRNVDDFRWISAIRLHNPFVPPADPSR